MMYAQYLRLESKAGGVACTNREFIRACLSVVKKSARGYRWSESRKAWLRDGLKLLDEARTLYGLVTRGR